jgi:hypothetical protein
MPELSQDLNQQTTKPKQPITEAQRAARRANARRAKEDIATGPRTAADKFRSSLNFHCQTRQAEADTGF